MKTSKNTINQFSGMLTLTIATQVFILIKNSIVAAHFGVSKQLDAFNFATSITNFVYSFIGASITTIIIPFLRDIKYKKSVDTFVTFIYGAGITIFIFLLIFRETLISRVSGTNDMIFIGMVSNIFIFTLFAGLANSVIGFANGVLEYEGKFNRQKLITFITNVLLVVMLIVRDNPNIYYYSSVVLFIAAVNLIFYLYFLKNSSYNFRMEIGINNKNFHEMLKLFLPVLLSSGVYQVSLLIDNLIAARLPVGNISILNYANSIINMMNLLFLFNLTSFFYPRLVNSKSEIDRISNLKDFALILNVILCLIMVLFFSAGREAISILYERGNFTSQNTTSVYICVVILAISLPTNGVRDLLYKYFYIKKDTMTPFINSIFISIVNIVISLVLSHFIGLYGVVIGTVIASYLSLTFILLRLKKINQLEYKGENPAFFLIENFKIILVTVISLLISFVVRNEITLGNKFISIVLYSLISILIYGLLLYLVRSKLLKIRF